LDAGAVLLILSQRERFVKVLVDDANCVSVPASVGIWLTGPSFSIVAGDLSCSVSVTWGMGGGFASRAEVVTAATNGLLREIGMRTIGLEM
jgi:hypothetical protein